MTERIITDSNGRKHITNEPQLHPPQRTWVGLEAEDRLCAKYMQDAPEGIEAVIDYIEAKLKQKNGYAEEKNT